MNVVGGQKTSFPAEHDNSYNSEQKFAQAQWCSLRVVKENNLIHLMHLQHMTCTDADHWQSQRVKERERIFLLGNLKIIQLKPEVLHKKKDLPIVNCLG